MKKNEIMELIQTISNNLLQGGIMSKPIVVSESTVLMGPGTDFDSISFVTLFMELEEKISEIAEHDIYLVLDVIQDLNADDNSLTVGALVEYVIQLLESEEAE